MKIKGLRGEDGNRGEVFVRASGDLVTENLTFIADDGTIAGANVSLTGRTLISIRNPDGAELRISAGNDLLLEYVLAKAPDITLSGNSVTVGAPGVLPFVRQSKLRTRALYEGITINSGTGPILLATVKIKISSQSGLYLNTDGPTISLLNSSISSGYLRLRPTSPSTCDLTGSSRKAPTPDFDDCNTIVGP